MNCVFVDMVYISGGYGGINKQAKKSAEMYNPDTDQWLSIKPMNWGRFGHAMVAMRGQHNIVFKEHFL